MARDWSRPLILAPDWQCQRSVRKAKIFSPLLTLANPPFVGARMMGAEQKDDVNAIFPGWKNAGNLDYVSCWYKKAADLMAGTSIRSALVSTNSVT